MKSADIAARGKGAAKMAGKILTGQTGIFATLAKEHGEISVMIKHAAKEDDPTKKTRAIEKIRVELLSHARAEEVTFYAALETHEQTRAFVDEALSEHRAIEDSLDRLSSLAGDQEEQQAELAELREVVEQHVDNEENVLFALADDVLSRDDRADLDEAFQERKDTLREEFEARAPLSSYPI